MKIQTKLRILITLYTFLPVFAIVLAVKESALFHHHDIQEALAIGVFASVLMTFSGHLFGMHWLLMRQLRTVKAFCHKIRRGDYAPVALPNEPADPDEENEVTALIRHMNWMAHQISHREFRLKKALASIEENNRELTAANAAIEEARNALWGEMVLARKIQTALVPSAPHLPGFEIEARMIPAEEVGGDYYDVISGNGCHWVIIGDVSGHGVSAGLIMMMAQTAVHTALNKTPEMCPSSLLSIVNRTLIRNIQQLNESTYMTMTALKISPDGEICYAGLHQDLIIYRAASRTVESLETSGMWLGVMEDISEMLPVAACRLNKGDCLLLYTDGLTESKNSQGRMAGEELLMMMLEYNGGKPVKFITDKIEESLELYSKKDDLTFLLIKYTPKETPENE